MASTVIGTPVNRVDGRQKVTGTAQYAAEAEFPNMSYAVLVGSPVPAGRIVRIETDEADRTPGVLLVLTHRSRGPLGEMPKGLTSGGAVAENRPPLEDEEILHVGQYVAAVVAETVEQATYAAGRLRIEYERAPFGVAIDDAEIPGYHPKESNGEELQLERGDADKALAEAEVRVDETYSTPNEHPCAMEPHATIASWSGDALTVYNSTQWIMGDRAVLAAAFKLPNEKVHVRGLFTGGMFGSKALTGPHVIVAAVAARQIGRPVKIVLSRTQVLTDVGHRSETVQHLEVGANQDGTITAIRHQTTSHTSILEEFAETTSLSSRVMYNVPHYTSTHKLVRLNVMKPSWMRAPGEAPGQFALESAMDELAYKLGMDPVELRRRNHASVNPHTGKPFSNKHLLECFDRGAQRFGWERRNPQPRSMREGKTLVGWGMATATYPGYLMGATVRVRLVAEDSGVRAVVSTAGSDVGTGMYTMLAITAADQLGLPVDRVRVEMGDSTLPYCAFAGGSNLTASTAPAATDACTTIKQQLLAAASRTADGYTGAEGHLDEFVFRDGRVAHRSEPGAGISYADLLATPLEGEGSTKPIFGQNDKYSFQSFGAHFIEVLVNELIGRVRVSRIVSVFDCGRILSPKTARSQFMGGIVFGIGQALLEELIYDRAHGQPINADLAGYLVPVNADVPEVDISWIDEPDFNFNSVGCRGVGEIGITGVAAAVANAVYHATGVRIRELPITPDRLLGL